MSYKQLNKEERFVIEKMKEQGYSLRKIATVLGRSPNTVAREIKVNSTNGIYNSKKAHHKHVYRRKYSKFQAMKVVSSSYSNRVIELLQKKISPEQIQGIFQREGIQISTKAIYKFVHSRNQEHLLFWGWNKKITRKKYVYKENQDTHKKYIDQRLELVRGVDYEMDFIVSKSSPWVLLVLVNRLSKKSHIFRLPNRKYTTISRVLYMFCNLNNVATITTDNDIAFKNWKGLEAHLNITIYFTFPYHSWEKGLVENCNRWIRCFIPKKQDIRTVTRKQINNALYFLNERPKKSLAWKTANEYERDLVV
jgi:transposase, IS30 family